MRQRAFSSLCGAKREVGLTEKEEDAKLKTANTAYDRPREKRRLRSTEELELENSVHRGTRGRCMEEYTGITPLKRVLRTKRGICIGSIEGLEKS